jgi:hypothetical protein
MISVGPMFVLEFLGTRTGERDGIKKQKVAKHGLPERSLDKHLSHVRVNPCAGGFQFRFVLVKKATSLWRSCSSLSKHMPMAS